ncbi:MAG: hypothetical protein CVV46_15710 [Spirochaetae bacterium HGW-Spirochaetae-2]|jgi:putative tricarboxylic transport membrane protein|nr:MAG: hypothetical protein CVV46_15710 [Spirochaetae bacterium HGW-Spirochaetae-2]
MAMGIGHRGLFGVVMRNRKVVFESIVLMLLGIATIIGSLLLDNFGEKVLAPGLFPSFLGGILVFLSALMLVRELRKAKIDGDGDNAKEIHGTVTTKKMLIRSGFLIFATVIYLVLLSYAGFIIATFVYVCSVMYLLGERRWWMLVLTPGTVAFLIFLVFEIGLKVYLP